MPTLPGKSDNSTADTKARLGRIIIEKKKAQSDVVIPQPGEQQPAQAQPTQLQWTPWHGRRSC